MQPVQSEYESNFEPGNALEVISIDACLLFYA